MAEISPQSGKEARCAHLHILLNCGDLLQNPPPPQFRPPLPSTAMSTSTLPVLVGGVPSQVDFVPSIIVASLYLLSLVSFIYRQFNPNTRVYTFCITSVSFSVERVVVWSLRAAQCYHQRPGDTLTIGLIIYQQTSYAIGFLSIANDIIAMARTTFTNTTLEDPARGSPDKPELRRKYRGMVDIYNLPYLVATVLASVAYGLMETALDRPSLADKVWVLTYVA